MMMTPLPKLMNSSTDDWPTRLPVKLTTSGVLNSTHCPHLGRDNPVQYEKRVREEAKKNPRWANPAQAKRTMLTRHNKAQCLT